jgi:hypothetical protein
VNCRMKSKVIYLRGVILELAQLLCKLSLNLLIADGHPSKLVIRHIKLLCE